MPLSILQDGELVVGVLYQNIHVRQQHDGGTRLGCSIWCDPINKVVLKKPAPKTTTLLFLKSGLIGCAMAHRQVLLSPIWHLMMLFNRSQSGRQQGIKTHRLFLLPIDPWWTQPKQRINPEAHFVYKYFPKCRSSYKVNCTVQCYAKGRHKNSVAAAPIFRSQLQQT